MTPWQSDVPYPGYCTNLEIIACMYINSTVNDITQMGTNYNMYTEFKGTMSPEICTIYFYKPTQ
jgi:hypothetical protein